MVTEAYLCYKKEAYEDMISKFPRIIIIIEYTMLVLKSILPQKHLSIAIVFIKYTQKLNKQTINSSMLVLKIINIPELHS